MIYRIFKSYGLSSFRCGASTVLDGIGLGLDAVGLGTSAMSQSDANATNLAIARETNAQNYKIHQEDIAHEIDMFNRTNEYNSPVQQVARLRAAGINPSAVLGSNGQNSGVAATMPHVPSAAPAVAASVEPIDLSPSFRAMSDDLARHFTNQNIDLQNDEKRFELLHQEERWLLEQKDRKADIDVKLADKNLKQEERNKLIAERNQIEQNVEIHEKVKEDIIKKYRLDNQQVEAETKRVNAEEQGQRLQNQYQQWFNEFSKKHGDKQLQLLGAQIKEALSSANLNDKNAELAVQQKIESWARKNKINFDMAEQRQLNNLIRRSIKLEQRQQGADYWNPFRYVGTLLSGAATAGATRLMK